MPFIKTDYTTAPLDDSREEGKHRCKITGVEVYPKDKEIDEATNMVIGEVNRRGKQKYASLQVKFEYLPHPSTMLADGTDLAGNSFTEMYSMSPADFCRKQIRRLLEATATPYNVDGAEFQHMEGVEVDVISRNKKNTDTGQMEGKVMEVLPVIESEG
jgi:hypothetical protein